MEINQGILILLILLICNLILAFKPKKNKGGFMPITDKIQPPPPVKCYQPINDLTTEPPKGSDCNSKYIYGRIEGSNYEYGVRRCCKTNEVQIRLKLKTIDGQCMIWVIADNDQRDLFTVLPKVNEEKVKKIPTV